MTMTWPDEKFIERYKAQYKQDVVYQLGNFYDMVSILMRAFEASGTDGAPPAPSSVVSYLKSIKQVEGVLGTLVQDADRAFQSTPSFFEIKNGRRVTAFSPR